MFLSGLPSPDQPMTCHTGPSPHAAPSMAPPARRSPRSGPVRVGSTRPLPRTPACGARRPRPRYSPRNSSKRRRTSRPPWNAPDWATELSACTTSKCPLKMPSSSVVSLAYIFREKNMPRLQPPKKAPRGRIPRVRVPIPVRECVILQLLDVHSRFVLVIYLGWPWCSSRRTPPPSGSAKDPDRPRHGAK
ncbi:hypothetical protein ADIAG_02940 [Paeniglutamicibacter gangotriensis Lz1y]|uniref:Uncharacterized protein n=1 Tax=Paeniglutamicibacter gangotriensis Lz1y TaxID=1276920 RepID=M7MRJ2_9MICC|nr:hypothetical protein ADIAG_02940 [Paeniglutamicibacter gangotriensis Lz1y]